MARYPNSAEKFIRFLLSTETQLFFARETFEYPVVEGVAPASSLRKIDELLDLAPEVRLGELEELDGTLILLREVGLL